MRKRLIALTVITPLFLSSQLSSSHAAAKAGAKCTKVGSKSVVGAKTFTCIKSGTKLIWNKGIKVVAELYEHFHEESWRHLVLDESSFEKMRDGSALAAMAQTQHLIDYLLFQVVLYIRFPYTRFYPSHKFSMR